jgi:hypothetical protein
VFLLLVGIRDVFSKASKSFYHYFHLFIQKKAYVSLYNRYFYLQAASRFGLFLTGKVSSDNGKVVFEQARKSYGRSGGTAPPSDLGTTRKSAVSLTPWPFHPTEKPNDTHSTGCRNPWYSPSKRLGASQGRLRQETNPSSKSEIERDFSDARPTARSLHDCTNPTP